MRVHDKKAGILMFSASIGNSKFILKTKIASLEVKIQACCVFEGHCTSKGFPVYKLIDGNNNWVCCILS